MTTEDLKQLRYLRMEVKRYETEISSVDRQLPMATGLLKKAMFDLRDTLAEILKKRTAERDGLELQLAGIENEWTRKAVAAHYIDGVAWDFVPDKLGLWSSGDSIKKMVYRYLK